MIHRLSLGSRLAVLFAACTALVSLTAGVLFSRASEQHFIELDQQWLSPRLTAIITRLANVQRPEDLADYLPTLRQDLGHPAELALRIQASDGTPWFDSRPDLPATPADAGLTTLHADGIDYRSLAAPLRPVDAGSPRVALLLDITHHQHFLQHMQRLIWLTVGLSALATALLGAWAVRRGLRPLRQIGRIAAGVSAHSLTTRLPVAHMPEELARLAEAVNAMLERLENAFERLSGFSADIAHELRTPLSNLLTHTQVTLSRPRSLETYREALHGNLEELQWMAQLVNDLLYLAKSDHGLLLPQRQPLALHEELDALLEFYAPLAEERGVELRRVGRGDMAGDRHMLRRAFSNVLDNALRFTPAQGQIVVTVDSLDGLSRVRIANIGPAIPADRLPRVFDRFYRVDPARREGQQEHAGLGLAITRSIVHAHGGCIRVHCEAGWTTFVFEWPQA
ncbi:heavy metal sensor histidine kinase [Pseudomonas alabamensis]|uniref:heavy metal sensor histidine kinase n=1 Tax=Pseudomonas alabamensis TaxID=3064349 RepID=UPI003F64E35F